MLIWGRPVSPNLNIDWEWLLPAVTPQTTEARQKDIQHISDAADAAKNAKPRSLVELAERRKEFETQSVPELVP